MLKTLNMMARNTASNCSEIMQVSDEMHFKAKQPF